MQFWVLEYNLSQDYAVLLKYKNKILHLFFIFTRDHIIYCKITQIFIRPYVILKIIRKNKER